jgi:hypothetical protein
MKLEIAVLEFWCAIFKQQRPIRFAARAIKNRKKNFF